MTMILDSYTFEWLPDEMTIPEAMKTIAVVPTYSGSAIFQWDATLEGARVSMKWDFMSLVQYDALRAIYLSSNEVSWVTGVEVDETPVIYNVVPIGLTGSYFQVHLDDLAYRENVEMVLDIRSQIS